MGGSRSAGKPRRQDRRAGPPGRRTSDLEEARLLSEIIENLPHMIFVKDADELRFVRLNRAGEQLLGYRREELLGKSDHDFFPPDEAAFFVGKDREVLDGGELVDIPREPIHTRAHGERILHTKKVPILGPDGRALYLLGISEDITELEQTQRELERATEELTASRVREAQKMELLGVLAGGIAHDFNNLLVGILGNASLLTEELGAQPRLREQARAIEAAAQRAAELTQQVLAYSGRGPLVVESVDAGALVGELVTLLRASVAKSAELSVHVERGTWLEADGTQLRQLVMNLIANASDALDGRPGRISVLVRHETLAAEEPSSPWDVGAIDDGRHVTIEVADTGQGMEESTRARIFEPFFTTKDHGHGLGLAAAVGIVQSHHGALRLTSELGKGTSFRVMFPCARPEQAPADSAHAPPTEIAEPAKGPTRVLVVDDEAMVRRLASTVLARAGFEVVEATDGVEALEACAGDPLRFDLVILDVSMPRMSGAECLEALRRLNPDLPVLFSSGYHETDARTTRDGRTGFLQKPYRGKELLAAARALLE